MANKKAKTTISKQTPYKMGHLCEFCIALFGATTVIAIGFHIIIAIVISLLLECFAIATGIRNFIHSKPVQSTKGVKK